MPNRFGSSTLWFLSICLLVLVVFLPGCMVRPIGYIPSTTPLPPTKIFVLGTSEGEARHFSLFGVAFRRTQIREAIGDAISPLDGDAMIDVEMWATYAGVPPIAWTTTFQVRGTVVQFLTPEQVEAAQQDAQKLKQEAEKQAEELGIETPEGSGPQANPNSENSSPGEEGNPEGPSGENNRSRSEDTPAEGGRPGRSAQNKTQPSIRPVKVNLNEGFPRMITLSDLDNPDKMDKILKSIQKEIPISKIEP